jgi:Ca2+-binding RTX toxin-like protein
MRTVLLAIGLLFATAAPAGAATVSLSSWSDGPYGAGNLSGGVIFPTYTAAPGETNDLTVTDTGSSLVFTDPGAPITASWHYAACTVSSDQHTATCPIQGARGSLGVSLGDGNDTAHVHPYATPYPIGVSLVDGGAGDDAVEADTGPLAGGAGDDTLTVTRDSGLAKLDGGPGADHVTGAGGTDLITGGPGDDVLDGAGGNDSLYDGSPENSTDDGRDDLSGGPGSDQLYARGGVDTLHAGDGDDTIFASDALTAPGSSTVATPDVVDCGPGSDAGLFDAADATTACETVHLGCDGLTTTPWIVPVGPCPAPVVGGGTGAGSAGAGGSGPRAPGPSTPAPVVVSPAPAPTPAAKPAPAPLTAKLRLSITRARPPLKVIPRALISLSATANVTITYARVTGGGAVALPGTIARRIAGGEEKNISLVVLLGGRQKFVAGRYRVTLAATTADGRTATASALIRMLAEKPAKRKPSKRHR